MKRYILAASLLSLAAATSLGGALAGTGAVIYRANPQVFEDSGIAAPGSQVPVKLVFSSKTGVLVNEASVLSAPAVATGPDAGFLLVARGGELRTCSSADCSSGGSFASSIRAANGGYVQARLAGPTTVGGVNRMTVESGSYTGTFEVSATSDAGLDPVADVVNAEPGSLQVSTVSTLKGFASTTLSITGGEYRLNGGAWTSASSTAKAGDKVELRVTTGAYGTAKTATVSVAGGAPISFTASARGQDTLPDAFTVASVANAEPGAQVVSASVTPTGYEGSVTISAAGGEVSVAGGAYATSGSIAIGQSFVVRTTSSASFGGTANAAVTLGTGAAVPFAVTTRSQDTLPDAFVIAGVTDAAPSTVVASASVVPTGFEGSVTLSVSGGEASVDGGAWTTTGALQAGQSFKVRLTSAATGGSTATANVRVGTGPVVGFSVTTKATPAVRYTVIGTSGDEFPAKASFDTDGTANVGGYYVGSSNYRGYHAKVATDGSVRAQRDIGAGQYDIYHAGTAAGSDGSVYGFGYAYARNGNGGSDVFAYKLASDGTIAWQRFIGGSTNEEAREAAVGPDGSLYLAISSNASGVYGGGVVKLSSDGSILWQRQLGSSVGSSLDGIAIGADGSVYVAGSAQRSGGTDYDAVVAKLKSDGTELWRKRLQSTAYESFYTLAVGSDGSAYAAGIAGVVGSGNNEGLAAKFDADGNIQWKTVFQSPDHDELTGVAVASDGSAVFGGMLGTSGLTGMGGGGDFFLARLSTTGSVAWKRVLGGTGYERLTDVGIDPSGAIEAIGSTNTVGSGARDFMFATVPGDGSGTGTIAAMSYREPTVTTAVASGSIVSDPQSWTATSFVAVNANAVAGSPNLAVSRAP